MEPIESFNILCDVVALVYHESRNVRHLVRQNLLAKDKWLYLMSLPTSREDAWREVAALRDRARQAPSSEAALRVFEQRFHVSLRDLAEMLADRNWRHARLYGGNAWAQIARLTIELAEAIDKDEQLDAEKLAFELKNAQHNTGSVREKLLRLDAARR